MRGSIVVALLAASFIIGCARAGTCVCQNQTLCAPITEGPRKEMYVFQVSKNDWKHYDWNLVTTMAVFGTFDPNMICVAHAANARVVLAADYDVTQLRNLTAASMWYESLLQKVIEANADGVNVDIEDPLDASQAGDLTNLIQNLTHYFHAKLPYSQVTFDVAWSPNCIDKRCYDYAGLAAATDFVVMMDYDMRSQIYGPCVASANSPPDLAQIGLKNFTDLGISVDKLVLGLPWYGYDYPCVSLENNDTVCNIEPIPFRGVNCSDAAGTEKGYNDLLALQYNFGTGPIMWDEGLKSPWFNYIDPKDNARHQVWFDNPLSLSIKTEWAKSQNLRGVGMWTGDFVDYKNSEQRDHMWEAMGVFFKEN